MTHQVLSFLACFAIALNVWGYIWQGTAIVLKKSGEAVSVAWFMSSFGLELANLLYGWSQSDRLFIFNSIVCGIGQICLLVALRTYRPFSNRERVLTAAVAGIVAAAIILPFKTAAQMAAQVANLYGGAYQPIQLRGGRNTGALGRGALMLSGFSSLIWTVYCWSRFGFLGPAAGYGVFSLYSGFLIWQWCKKSRSARSS